MSSDNETNALNKYIELERAIMENSQKIGDLTQLNTSNKSSLVEAINELLILIGKEVTPPVESIPVIEVQISESFYGFTSFTTHQLNVVVLPLNATDKDVVWKSSDTNIITVNNTGLVTAKSNGIATVTVTSSDGNKTAMCSIVVDVELPPAESIPVTEVQISKSLYTFTSFTTMQLSESVLPSNATNKSVIWTSTNPSIATVSNTGLVTAKSNGNCAIIVTTVDGNKTSACDIIVEEAQKSDYLNVISSTINVIDSSQDIISVDFTSNRKLKDIKISFDNGDTYNNNLSMTQTSAIFSIGSKSNGIYNCRLKGIYYDESTYDLDTRVKDLMYPMPQDHQCIPHGAPVGWKYKSTWETITKPSGWIACAGWAQIYRVDGTEFGINTGVEIKDYYVYGWKNGQWNQVLKMNYPNGAFYAEDFTEDAHDTFPNSFKNNGNSITIKFTEDMVLETSQGTKNVCYHPFTQQTPYDNEYEHIFTCVKMRKVKFDENGVDDRNTTRYCASCGGDWWRAVGLEWLPDWSNNKGIAQPKITEIKNDWQIFSMSTVPENWSNGFPMEVI